MDEIDGMNNGDKGGINSLIKLIRPKKTNKQKKEQMTMLPIICIGNYHIDKKIKEIIKICTPIELKKPKNDEINNILNILMPNIDDIIKKINQDKIRVVLVFSKSAGSTFIKLCKKHKIKKSNLVKIKFVSMSHRSGQQFIDHGLHAFWPTMPKLSNVTQLTKKLL